MISVSTKLGEFTLVYHDRNKMPYILLDGDYKFGIKPERGFFQTYLRSVNVDGVDEL